MDVSPAVRPAPLSACSGVVVRTSDMSPCLDDDERDLFASSPKHDRHDSCLRFMIDMAFLRSRCRRPAPVSRALGRGAWPRAGRSRTSAAIAFDRSPDCKNCKVGRDSDCEVGKDCRVPVIGSRIRHHMSSRARVGSYKRPRDVWPSPIRRQRATVVSTVTPSQRFSRCLKPEKSRCGVWVRSAAEHPPG
jgi:hypothetical protein